MLRSGGGDARRSAVSRGEFEAAVLGRSPAEVWGRYADGPLPTGIGGVNALTLRGVTRDPTSGWPDATAEVLFEGGKAVRVEYP